MQDPKTHLLILPGFPVAACFIVNSPPFLTLVQLAALGSKSLRVTSSFNKLLSWYPPFTPRNLKYAWGLDRMRCRFTANPAMSIAKGRCGSNTVFQPYTFPKVFTLGDSYRRPPTKATGHTDTFLVDRICWLNTGTETNHQSYKNP